MTQEEYNVEPKLGRKEKHRIRQIVRDANDFPFYIDLHREGVDLRPGDNWRLRETFGAYRAVFTHTHCTCGDERVFRHLSVYVNRKCTGRTAWVLRLAEAFGFTGSGDWDASRDWPKGWTVKIEENCFVIQQELTQ